MADMEETGQTTGFEDDPAAAFLAREQDELADIAGDALGFGTGDSVVSIQCTGVVSFVALPSVPSHTHTNTSKTGQVPPQQDIGDMMNGDIGQEVKSYLYSLNCSISQ